MSVDEILLRSRYNPLKRILAYDVFNTGFNGWMTLLPNFTEYPDFDVPPTLVSFAVDMAKTSDVVTGEFKKAGNVLVKFAMKKDSYELPDYAAFAEQMSKITKLAQSGKIASMYALGAKGIAEAVSKMAFGNRLGAVISDAVSSQELFAPAYGDILAEISKDCLDALNESGLAYKTVGTVTEAPMFVYGGETVTVEEALDAWTNTLEKVFPTRSGVKEEKIEHPLFDAKTVYVAKNKVTKPRVFIPVFPGTNCEYDTMRSFRDAGAEVSTVVFRNRNEQDIRESVEAFEKEIRNAQILMFPGGFSAGDEPDGSGKFIATAFRNAKITDAVNDMLKQRDGLVLGICNGFQAIIKLGLVPYGEVTPQKEDSPTLTMNSIGRHISKSVYTKVVTNKSPWLMEAELGGVYAIPASHGEGRFVASKEWIEKLAANGQIATQYVDLNGNPTMDEDFNPNGSYFAIEGITSPDGRVLGKMAHSERRGNSVAVNIYGDQDQRIFASGVKYFK